MKNKIYIGLGIILFGVITSYVAFSWSEPTSMPSGYLVPINTSDRPQDVAQGKPVVGNLDVEMVGGYTSSDLLGLMGGGGTNMVIPIAATVTPEACPTGWLDFGVLSITAGGHYTRYCYKDSAIDGSPYNLDASINSPLIPEESKTITVNFGGPSSTVEVSCNSGTLDYSIKQNVVSYAVFNLTNIAMGQDLICNIKVSNSYGEISTEKIWPKPPVVTSVSALPTDFDKFIRYFFIDFNIYSGPIGGSVTLKDPVTYEQILSIPHTNEVPCSWECFDISNNSLGIHEDTQFPTGTVKIIMKEGNDYRGGCMYSTHYNIKPR